MQTTYSVSPGTMYQKVLLQIYYGQFHSHLNYGSQIWSTANDLQSTIIQQKKALRIISWSHSQSPSNPLFKEWKILKLTDMVKMNNLLFVHDVLNNRAPDYFNGYFHVNERNHSYDTINNPTSRHSVPTGSLKLPNTQNQEGIKTVKYSFAHTWNDFIKEIARSTANSAAIPLKSMSRHSFKSLITKHLFS